MEKKIKHKKDQDNRAEYVPPQVMRLEDVRNGQGACSPTGTGDSGDCYEVGYNAQSGCLTGWNAAIDCQTGNDPPVSACEPMGLFP